MQPAGRVVALENELASVYVVRHTACDNCRACSLGSSEAAAITVKALNPVNAVVGDNVALYFPEETGIKAALLVYTVPLLTLFVTYALITLLPVEDSALWAAIGSLGCCFASFLLLKPGEKKRQQDLRYLPAIISVLPDSEV